MSHHGRRMWVYSVLLAGVDTWEGPELFGRGKVLYWMEVKL